jgi:hypothetical protein
LDDGQFDSLRVFDGEDDEHDVERVQVEIASKIMKRIDRLGIDCEMLGDGTPHHVMETIVHGFPRVLQMVPSDSV